MRYYPLFLDILGKKCVVVGGGEVAARKVTRLLECGANVVVVSPELTPELARLKTEGTLEYFAAMYNIQYLEGAVLIIGATDDENTNAAISSDAGRLGIQDGDHVKIESRRGSLIIKAFITERVSTGAVFAKFHFAESPINLLTNAALDPISKIPELKVCAVRVEKAN